MRILYNLGILLYSLLVKMVSPFNQKAKLWVIGRKSIMHNIKIAVEHETDIVWFHCASLGEFEQGRPIIEEYKKRNASHKVLLTFFSPSGYEIRKNYEGADYVFYLPSDTRRNARKFVKYVNPKFALFVKYELWINYIDALHKQNVPLYIASAIFRPSQVFFQWYGKWYLKSLAKISQFFVQNEQSKQLLNSHGINSVQIAGDTRFDRVIALLKQSKHIEIAEKFKGQSQCLVAGSTWNPDEELIINYLNNNKELKAIIAPHEISKENIERIKSRLEVPFICYSEAEIKTVADYNVLIIDNIGMLSSLYKYGEISYIGGGFGRGIHNTLEAATFAKPVVFGPKYTKFDEAVQLVQNEAAFSISSQEELNLILNKLTSNTEYCNTCGSRAFAFVNSNSGATELVISCIEQ